MSLKVEVRADDRQPVSAAPPFDQLPDGLDWGAFSARRFPNGRRHDFDAIAAYFAYRQHPGKVARCSGTAAGVEAWEDEGGSTP